MKTSDVLISALGYIRKFQGQVFIIKLGGEVALSDEILDSIAQDVILLNYVGIHPVVLHGGGHEISKAMECFGKKPVFVEGLRVTDKETMDIVEMVLTGKVNANIIARINKHGGNAVGLSGKAGRLFIAEKKKNTGVDLGLVGEIKEINTGIIDLLLKENHIPVISPVGLSTDGTTLNINADTVASELAVALKASKLIFLTNVDGVLDEKNNLIKNLTSKEALSMIKKKTAKGGMIPKIRACVNALKGGVERAHIIKASRHAILEEIFTTEGTGTMITGEKVKS